MSFDFVENEPAKPARPAGEAKAAGMQLPVLIAQQGQPPCSRPAAPAKPVDNRRASRKPVKLNGHVAGGAQQALSCTVIDMSAMGAMLEVQSHESRRHGGESQVPPQFYLVVENLLERSVVECQVIWQQGRRAGVQFVGPIDSTAKKLPARRPSPKTKPGNPFRR
jgi:hypothetical protein